MSVVIMVFCVGVCVTLAAEAKTMFKAKNTEVVIAQSR